MSLAVPSARAPGIRLQRVRKAYEQIADQVRDLILLGELTPGVRLPTEQELSVRLGTSRGTVRESLRVLAAEGLISTAKGTGGGSYVAQPSMDRISGFMSTNISLMSRSDGLTLDELLEARSLFEVPAARLAAERREAGDVERLLELIPLRPLSMDSSAQFLLNRDFHSAIVDISRNRLLGLAAQPIFVALQTRLGRAALDEDFHTTVAEHHRTLAAAIQHGVADEAEKAMADHLAWLRPAYERARRE
jgi:DNA-binding FadR family transcriptional regulator